MIKEITHLIEALQADLSTWGGEVKPWFRGESGYDQPPLCPKIAKLTAKKENYLLQSFRRQAGGLVNPPPREGHTDLWLFKAQHYGVPTRLLDWTEGALFALYFAINKGCQNPRIYMLNSQRLNELAFGQELGNFEYPLSWVKLGKKYVSLAWEQRELSAEHMSEINNENWNLDVPIAFPATYQDQRMIAQRSCFTIHGTLLEPLVNILTKKNVNVADYVTEYQIDLESRILLLKELSILGVSASSVFPDLDHIAKDLISDLGA